MSEARLMPFEGSTNVDGVLSLRPKARTQAARHALLCYRYGEQRVSTGPALRAWIGRQAEFSGPRCMLCIPGAMLEALSLKKPTATS